MRDDTAKGSIALGIMEVILSLKVFEMSIDYLEQRTLIELPRSVSALHEE